jgi:hypothetical protein
MVAPPLVALKELGECFPHQLVAVSIGLAQNFRVLDVIEVCGDDRAIAFFQTNGFQTALAKIDPPYALGWPSFSGRGGFWLFCTGIFTGCRSIVCSCAHGLPSFPFMPSKSVEPIRLAEPITRTGKGQIHAGINRIPALEFVYPSNTGGKGTVGGEPQIVTGPITNHANPLS